MDEQEAMNQSAAFQMARANYMSGSSNDINSLLEKLTNPELQIQEVELRLKGKKINEKGEEVQVSEPLLNDEGVANMIVLIRSMVNQVMFMSNLTEEQVAKLTEELGWDIIKDLINNKIKYEVKEHNRSKIVSIILYPSYESANSALENGFRRFLKSGIIETTINTQGNPMGKQGKGGGVMGLLGLGRK